MTTIKSSGQPNRIRFHSHSHARTHTHIHIRTHTDIHLHIHITLTSHTVSLSLSLPLAATDNLKSCPIQIQITRANQNRQIVSAKLDELAAATPPPPPLAPLLPLSLLVRSVQVQFKMLITTHDVYCLWNNWNQTTRSNSYELYYVLTRSRRTDRQSTLPLVCSCHWLAVDKWEAA